ncbi:hypothetical protein ACEQUB_01536 [Ralstonia syzygii]
MNKESRQAVIPPYGVAIHDAIVGGDLKKMKALPRTPKPCWTSRGFAHRC